MRSRVSQVADDRYELEDLRGGPIVCRSRAYPGPQQAVVGQFCNCRGRRKQANHAGGKVPGRRKFPTPSRAFPTAKTLGRMRKSDYISHRKGGVATARSCAGLETSSSPSVNEPTALLVEPYAQGTAQSVRKRSLPRMTRPSSRHERPLEMRKSLWTSRRNGEKAHVRAADGTVASRPW